MAKKTIADAIRDQILLSNIPSHPYLKDNPVSALNIISKLLEHGFRIASAEPIAYAMQIRLTCGAIVNIFTSGKVVVQGKATQQDKLTILMQLEKALPAATICYL